MDLSRLPLSLRQHSVLPDNQSPLERALELSFACQLYGTDNPLPELLDPKNTPTKLLPYLAHERQTATWDPGDDEQTKRDLVAAAWPMRRLSGTRQGLRLAFASLGYELEVTPWHKIPGAQPYHMHLLAWPGPTASASQNIIERLITQVDEAKSERDNYELTFALGANATLGTSGAAGPFISYFELAPQSRIQGSPVVTGSLGLAANWRSINILSLAPASKI